MRGRYPRYAGQPAPLPDDELQWVEMRHTAAFRAHDYVLFAADMEVPIHSWLLDQLSGGPHLRFTWTSDNRSVAEAVGAHVYFQVPVVEAAALYLLELAHPVADPYEDVRA